MHYAVHRVLFRESIFWVYAVIIPVRPLFVTSSLVSLITGTHSDVFSTALRRACGASCIRLSCKFPIGHADRNFGPLLCLVPYFTHLSVVLRAVNTPLVMLSATLVLFCASCRISPIDQTGSNFGTNCTHAVLVKM